MYEIEKGLKKINDCFVETYIRSVTGHGTKLEVEAGTTGYKGTPCRKGGGRTYLRFKYSAGDQLIRPITDDRGESVGVEFVCCGDAGLDAVVKALDFARDAISDQICEIND